MGRQVEKGKKKTVEKAPRRAENDLDAQTNVDLFPLPSRETVKPELQLSLTDAELEEEIPQMLTANNPEAPHNISRFHSKERCYKLEAMVEQCAVHFATDGWLLHKNSEEGKKQIENEKLVAEAFARAEAEHTKHAESNTDETENSKQLRNQFNYSDRSCQTLHPQRRTRGCYTEPPTTTVRCGSCSQWDIYDDYCRDIETQRAQEHQNRKKSTTVKKKVQQEEAGPEQGSMQVSESREGGVSLRAAKVMERMTMQNIFDEVIMDLKYWDDTSDEFRPNEASLLPLWKFQDKNTVGKYVTTLCSNSRHSDVFAVGYGSYESLKQTRGVINVYSIKNPSVPEKTSFTESGVLALAFHPDFSNLLAAGCYDGSVRVLDTKGDCGQPLYLSDGQTRRHTEPVWELSWKAGTVLGELQLFSASTDGTVGLWTFTRSEMLFETIMICSFPPTYPNHSSQKHGLISLDFNKMEETMYVIGTEQGLVHRCSTEYDSEYLDTYCAHEQSVYSVKWNFFHPNIFLTASEDWTVKLWDSRNSKHPIATFELNSPVTSIAWAPYSSTVFVAVTDTGKVYAFDLVCNRHTALCEQKVISKGRLTTVIFHPRQPLLLVGDSTGVASTLKLSPNLRKDCMTGESAAEKEHQRTKLERVLEQLTVTVV